MYSSIFPDPMPTLIGLRQAIKMGGVLFCGVPTLDNLAIHGKKKYCINRRYHFSGFTRRSLSTLLARAGFNAVEFSASKGPHCMRCVAVPADDAVVIPDPLRDARKAFAAYRQTQRGTERARL